MKIGTRYNRVTHYTYTLNTSDLTEAIKAYVSRRLGRAELPSNAREEFELDFGDSHDEAVTLTRRFIYDDELPERSDEAQENQQSPALEPSNL